MPTTTETGVSQRFAPFAVLRVGWETFKRRPWFFIWATFILGIVYVSSSIVSGLVDVAVSGSFEESTITGLVVDTVFCVLLYMGIIAFFLAAYRNPETVRLAELWHPRPFWKYLAIFVLETIAVGIGLLLFIVPGLVAMVFFMFATILVIDRELGPLAALKESARLTKGNRWPLLGFVILLTLMFLAGALAFGLGLLIVYPIMCLSVMHAYQQLSGGEPQTAIPEARLDL